MSDIMFNKLRNVKTPTQAYEFAAATDFFTPEYDKKFYDDLLEKNPNKDSYECMVSADCSCMQIVLKPNARIIIPSGIRVIIKDTNTCLMAVNKSGVAAKKGLVHGACLIDPDFQGEIDINLINTSNEEVPIKTGDKIIQFMCLPVLRPAYKEILTEDFYKLQPTSKRGTGGFGSSGK